MGSRRQVCAAVIVIVAGCGKQTQEEPDAPAIADSCNNLGCFVVDCAAKGLPPTTVTGTVFAPNGTLPLFGVNVYVPSSDPGPLTPGVTCDRCSSGLQGGALAATTTDEAGNFRLENVPATGDVPIVVQTGKWRRQFTVPVVAACQDNTTEKAATTLPKDKSEGDLPAIAITTGSADALECLVRKLGIADTEFGVSGDTRAVHLYQGNGANKFAVGFAGGAGNFAPAKPFWDSRAALDTYDIVVLSCEGNQNIDAAGGVTGVASLGLNDKPQSSLQAVHDYAGIGGRVFMSHWHNVWIGGDRRDQTSTAYGMADWKTIGDWGPPAAPFGGSGPANAIATIDLGVPKGMSFATWLMNVGGSPTSFGQLDVVGARYTLPGADPTRSDRRVFIEDTTTPQLGDEVSVQDLQFTTPNDVPVDQRCGKVVFSDMHVSEDSSSNAATPFPGGCDTGDLTAQEKALAFIFFDISSCVGVLQ